MRLIHRTRTRLDEPSDPEREVGIYLAWIGSGNPWFVPGARTRIERNPIKRSELFFDCVPAEKVYDGLYPRTPCTHITSGTHYYDTGGSFGRVDPVDGYDQTVDSRFYLKYIPEAPHANEVDDLIDFVMSKVDLSDILIRGFNEMKPSLRPEIDLTVFLAELKEIKEMYSYLIGRQKDGSLTFLPEWFRDDKRIVHQVADTHLATVFGYLPFAGDVKALYDSVKSLDQRLREYFDAQGKWITRHYQEKIDIPPEITEEVVMDANPFQRTLKKERYTLQGCTVNVEMTFRFSIPEWDDVSDAPWQAYLDAMGLHLSPAQVWELTPFSFLLDYIVNIGGFLSQFDKDFLLTELEVASFSYSVKFAVREKAEADNRVHPDCNDPAFYGMDYDKIWNRYCNYYRRRYQAPPVETDIAGIESGSGIKWLIVSSLASGFVVPEKSTSTLRGMRSRG